MFFEEFSCFLETLFNSLVESTLVRSSFVAIKFLDLFDSFILKQPVKEETQNGYTLDLVITRSHDHDLISHVFVTDPENSDHYAVLCKYPYQNHVITEARFIIENLSPSTWNDLLRTLAIHLSQMPRTLRTLQI